jgi:hypothetical protein
LNAHRQMDVALHRRRLFVALGVTALAVVIAALGLGLAFGVHAGWGLWLFGGAILAGFASHWWLVAGVLRERQAP